jgi:hypothetical protein
MTTREDIHKIAEAFLGLYPEAREHFIKLIAMSPAASVWVPVLEREHNRLLLEEKSDNE